jgi:hypothetical protein
MGGLMTRSFRKLAAAFVASCLLAMGSAQMAAAQSATGLFNAPNTVYAFSGGYGGFYSVPYVPTTTCVYDMFFIDTTTSAGNSIFALMLTAHTTQEKITTIYYHVAGNGWCWIDRLDIHRP